MADDARACDCASDCTDCAPDCADCEECCEMSRRAPTPATGDIVRYEMPIIRTDGDRREVWGWASSTAKGHDKRIISHEANKTAFAEWISRGNIREMHEPIAAGKALNYTADDANERIHLGVRISRGAESTWLKVEDGTLSAFSVRGPILESHTEVIDGQPWQIVDRMRISEVSLVDAGGDPTSHFTEIIRREIVEDGELPVPETLADDMNLEIERLGAHGGQMSHSHDHEHPSEGVLVQHDHTHEHPANRGEGEAHSHGHAGLEDHTILRTDDDPPPTEHVVQRADDEAEDVSLAGAAIEAVNALLMREVAETVDENDDNEGMDVGLLLQVRAMLSQFARHEAMEGADMTMERLTRAVVDKANDLGILETPTPADPVEAVPGDLLRMEGPSPADLLLKIEEQNQLITALTTQVTEMHEHQDELSRAGDPVVARLDTMQTQLEEILDQERPGNRPVTRLFPVEKAFGLEDGQTEVTRDQVTAGFDALRKAAHSPEDLERINGLQATMELKAIYAEGARPTFR